MNRYLLLTCDTEALPDRAPSDHVARLIQGRFPGLAKDAGIGLMMDIADEFGCKVSFFLDVLERALYGGQIDVAGKGIIDRGHDLQLHAHPTLLPDSFWNKRGYEAPTWCSQLYDEVASRLSLGHAIEAFEEIAGRKPLAYRAGAFRYNRNELQFLAGQGVKLSFNYCPTTRQRKEYPFGYADGILPVFRWSNGMVEIPCALTQAPDTRRYSHFDYHNFDGLDAMRTYVDEFWSNGPEHNVLVLVLHSWAFLVKDESGHYVYRDDSRIGLFRDFLGMMAKEAKIVSVSELGELLDVGEIVPLLEKDISLAGEQCVPLAAYNPHAPAPTEETKTVAVAAPAPAGRRWPVLRFLDNRIADARGIKARLHRAISREPVTPPSAHPALRSDFCNVCGASRDEFLDFGGRAKCRCAKCMAFERTRIFAWVYEQFIKKEFPFEEQEILACAPGPAEIDYIFKHAKRFVSFDIQPVKWYDLQLDISDMPSIGDASFDCVAALAVMQHVRREKEAIDEVWRVLRPGGRFLVQASSVSSGPTREFEDKTKHYGKEALEKYGVGTYRIYGDLDLIELLSRRFTVKTYYGIDPVTGTVDYIACGVKR